MSKKILFILGIVLSMSMFSGCKNNQTETAQEAKINTQGKVFACSSSVSKIYSESNTEEPVEEYHVTKDLNGDITKEKMIMIYPEFQQDYEAIYTYRYDESGNKLKATCDIIANGNHRESVIEYANEYDNNGNLVKVESDNILYEYKDGELIRLTTNADLTIITEYENGKTISVEQYDGEALKLRESYTYDVYGIKTSYKYFSSVSDSEIMTEYNLEYEFNDDGYIKKITSTTQDSGNKDIYLFDEYGNNILIEHYDDAGVLYQLDEFEYVEVKE